MEANTDKRDIDTKKEIDLIDLGKKLWAKRKVILKASLLGLLIGVIIAFGIPKEYTTTVILAPESGSSSGSGNVGALAAMAGINLGASSNERDIAPELYPNIIESTPFILGLFDVRVRNLEYEVDTTLYYYIKDGQKRAWWAYVMGFPGAVLGVFSKKDIPEKSDVVNKLSLSPEQTSVFGNLKDRINIIVDKKTGIISLSSTMQNPEISASIADTLISYLQSYIINYRTQKARQDLAFTERLYTEAKKNYSETQQKYAQYLDANQNVILASYRVNQEKLQNEVALTYGVYNQMAQQLQLAKVKVQDTTPVYTIIQPAIIPLAPIRPNKKLIILGFVVFAIILSGSFVLAKDIWFKS